MKRSERRSQQLAEGYSRNSELDQKLKSCVEMGMMWEGAVSYKVSEMEFGKGAGSDVARLQAKHCAMSGR